MIVDSSMIIQKHCINIHESISLGNLSAKGSDRLFREYKNQPTSILSFVLKMEIIWTYIFV